MLSTLGLLSVTPALSKKNKSRRASVIDYCYLFLQSCSTRFRYDALKQRSSLLYRNLCVIRWIKRKCLSSIGFPLLSPNFQQRSRSAPQFLFPAGEKKLLWPIHFHVLTRTISTISTPAHCHNFPIHLSSLLSRVPV